MRKPIYVVGYPRSGNTWLSRLLGDILNSPVEGYKNAKPIATEGQDRGGDYVVRQLHLKPVEYEIEDGLTANEISIPMWDGDGIVTITRDPRDVAVSAMYYWNIPDIDTTVKAMGEGLHPLIGVGSWSGFVESWLSIKTIGIVAANVFYEDLYWNPESEIYRLLSSLRIRNVREADVVAALNRQEINVKRNQVKLDGDRRPYGKEIQIKHLRKGIVGDWTGHFTRKTCELSQHYFGDLMLKIGYIENERWFDNGNYIT